MFGLSPFEDAAELRLEPFEPLPLVVLTAIAVAAAAVGLLAFRRRDLDVR